MKKEKRILTAFLSGGIIGFINGFFGGGGGMIVVPLLQKYYKMEEKEAHATSIAVILPITVISAIVYLFKESMRWKELGFVSIGVLLGGIFGAIILKKASNKVIEYIFEAVMLFAGVRLLFF